MHVLVSVAPLYKREVGIDDDTHICTSVLDNDADSKYYRLVFLKSSKVLIILRISQFDILIINFIGGT